MAYTILPLWFGPTIMPHRVSRLLADAPVRFSRTLVTTSDIPAGASGSSADFGISAPPGRIAGWLATVTSLATRLSQLARPDDSHGCIGFRSQARRGLNVEGSSTSIAAATRLVPAYPSSELNPIGFGARLRPSPRMRKARRYTSGPGLLW